MTARTGIDDVDGRHLKSSIAKSRWYTPRIGRLPARTIRYGSGGAQLVTRPHRPRCGGAGGVRFTSFLMHVYVIQSRLDQSEYIGMSANPYLRLLEHNAGRVHSTRSKRPWQIIHVEELPNRIEAKAREKYLKSAAGRRFRKSLRARIFLPNVAV